MPETPAWLKNAIFYEIYPQSFYDSNGDGIGDLQGIIQKLDYVKNLGCNAIWMNPCFESPFRDAGYDVSDYYAVAPRYGTMDDLQQLFEEIHKRGMHIILDLVAGHTSDQHPWFKESSKPERNEFSDRFIWTKQEFDDMQNMRGMYGMTDRPGAYAVNFFSFQPALNYGFAEPEYDWQFPVYHPSAIATREELKKIMRFWLDKGCDGFRVDMAHSLVKKDLGRRETIKIWQEILPEMKTNYPEAAFVSEWGWPTSAITAGFHMDFYLHFGVRGYNALFRNGKRSFFSEKGLGNIKYFTEEYIDLFRETNSTGYISFQTGNHDMVRLAKDRSQRQLELAFAFLLTVPGVPFIYYGDEIGMKYVEGLISKEGGYSRTGSRTPMQWTAGKNAGFSSADADKMYLPIDPDPDFPTVEKQEANPASLLNFVKKMIGFKREHAALGSDAEFSVLYARENLYPFIYSRNTETLRFVIIMNPSEEPQTVAKDEAGFSLADAEVLMDIGGVPVIKDDVITVPPESCCIYRMNI
ncbi:hypothetical protein K7I13_13015 [Brucepastera parasyntrophica]|uniref:alpha-amylase family glycosyl hydrolase n=1 Tax=Brucepastera parasyntrophica TaxID=2880008 RepID=UPI002109BF69|nr:alpha-amylase family glycosyl hydrolase [Brucepastera parasyntrophica]ULQ59386.1 hypothetical protein K7I13_13015 [Brucepastera parasyntrophica]